MKRVPFVLVSIILFSFWTNAQGSLQTSRQVNSFGTIAYSTQSLVIKHFTLNCYGIFDTTPQIYAGLYDMTEADSAANVVAGIAQVKQIKPDFKPLLYGNIRTADPIYPGRVELFAQNGWLLKDQNGNHIQDDVGWLVDVGNSAYQAWIANYLKTQINSVGYDGVFADWGMAGEAGELFYGAEAAPINPRTNEAWTDAEARQALIGLHNAIKSAIGSKLLLCNGIFGGYRFYDHQSAYKEILSASSMDGFMSEGAWYPNSDNPQWMSEQVWQQAVQFLIWVQDNFLSGHSNRFYVPVVKLAYGNQAPTSLPSGCTREQMATFAYASTLLGVKTGQAAQIYFSTAATGVTFDSKMQPLYTAQIGTPTNDWYMIGGTHVYARDFSNGKVLVNPTGQQYSVSLGQTYVTLEGQIVSSLIMEPHTGVILKSRT